MNSRFVTAIVITTLTAACGGSPTAPGSTYPLAGTWIGEISDHGGATGTATLVLTETGPGVTGTYTVMSGTATMASSGTAGGTASGATLSLFLTPSTPLVCSPGLTLTGTVGASLTVTGRRMSGQYLVTTCAGGRTGSLDLTLR